MIFLRCKLFYFVKKIKRRKVCLNNKVHTRVYIFDLKKICLIDKKERSYTISTFAIKEMFSALLYDQISFIDYVLLSPKNFIMNQINIILNCIRLSSRLNDTF